MQKALSYSPQCCIHRGKALWEIIKYCHFVFDTVTEVQLKYSNILFTGGPHYLSTQYCCYENIILLGVIASSAQITMVTTVAFILHIFSSSLFRPCFFSVLLFLPEIGVATSIASAVFLNQEAP